MTLNEARNAAKTLSLQKKGKKVFVIEAEAGEVPDYDFTTKDADTKSFPVLATFVEGEEVKEGDNVKTKSMTKTAKKVPAKKVAAKKEKAVKVKTIIRGNNMALTKEEWVKVDAKLEKEKVSFSAFSKGLVRKAVGL